MAVIKTTIHLRSSKFPKAQSALIDRDNQTKGQMSRTIVGENTLGFSNRRSMGPPYFSDRPESPSVLHKELASNYQCEVIFFHLKDAFMTKTM